MCAGRRVENHSLERVAKSEDDDRYMLDSTPEKGCPKGSAGLPWLQSTGLNSSLMFASRQSVSVIAV